MKLVRLPTKKGGDWWIVVHDLSISNSQLLRLRPIHLFTFLAQALTDRAIKNQINENSFALENKLFAVRYHLDELRKAIAECNDLIYVGKYIRDYDDQQRLISVIEAYLNSIYSALEITAQLNRLLTPSLPFGFRDQCDRGCFFSFDKWKWLGVFYDLRHEFEHFGTSLPQISSGSLIFNIKRLRKKFALKEGRFEISLTSILSFSVNLFDMLDQWALKELEKANPEFQLIVFKQTHLNSPLKSVKTTAKKVLKLLPSISIKKIEAGGRSAPRA